MTITQLIYFIAAAEQHSLTRVAEQFHVSQPAVSSVVRDLEKEYDIQLFKRTHRELTLTEDGIVFYQRAVSLVEYYRQFEQEMSEKGRGIPKCSLAMTINLAPLYLPGLYEYLKTSMPEYSADVHEERASNIISMVKSGLLDVGCLGHVFDESDQSLHKQQVSSFSLQFCVHRKLVRFDKARPDLSDLRDIPLALYSRGTTLNQTVRDHFSSAGITPQVIFEVSQMSTIEAIVRQGTAGGFLNGKLFAHDSDILIYPFPALDYIPVYLIWKNQTLKVETLLRHSRAYFRGSEGSGRKPADR